MSFENLLKDITKACEHCPKCEPCCTGYIMKKYIESRKSSDKGRKSFSRKAVRSAQAPVL